MSTSAAASLKRAKAPKPDQRRKAISAADPSPTPAQIRAAREGLGITQDAAGRLAGVTRVAWARYEIGTRRMPGTLWRYWRHVAGIERMPFTPPASRSPSRS